MSRNIKRTKIDKKPIDEEAMNDAFNKVREYYFSFGNRIFINFQFLSSQNENDDDDIHLETYVDRYFNNPENAEKLQVLFAASLTDACRRLAENHDEDTASKIIE